MCMSVAAIFRKLNLTNGNEGISTLHTCSSNSWSMQVDTMDPSLSNSTPMDLLNARDRLRLEREERLLLDCSVGTKETRSEDQSRPIDRLCLCRAVEQAPARQTRLATDCQRTHERRAAEGYRQARLERLCEHNVKLNMLQIGMHQLPLFSFIGMSCMIPPHCQCCSLFVALPHLHYQKNYCQPNCMEDIIIYA